MIVLRAVQNIFGSIKVFVPYGSEIEKAAFQNGFEIVYEAFGDRNYNDDLTLVSRSQKNAMMTNPKEVFAHILRMAKTSKVLTVNGIEKEIKASTFCLHGDAINTVKILKYIHMRLNFNKS